MSSTGARNTGTTSFDWSQNCVAPLTAKELIRLGNERWYSRQFCAWLHDKKYVGLFYGDLLAKVIALAAEIARESRHQPFPLHLNTQSSA